MQLLQTTNPAKIKNFGFDAGFGRKINMRLWKFTVVWLIDKKQVRLQL
jgi:hypothetical protein